MTKRGFLFDLDGTLVDTVKDFAAVINGIRRTQQLPALPPHRLLPLVNAGAAAMTEASFDIDQTFTDFDSYKQRFLDAYGAELGKHAEIYPGLAPLLTQIDRAGLTWGIVTNKPRRFAERLVAKLHMQPAVLVCGDDITHSKPAPDALLLASEQLRIAPTQLGYCGDHQRDIAAGRKAGMYTIGATYGYLAPEEDISQWQADAYATSPDLLAQQVLSFLQAKT
jgi:N-acetyl-D-muramate 6-phosphate phosphatase